MAQKTVVHLVDDLDKVDLKGDGQTVTFAFRQAQYEIDLSEKNAQRLHDALAPYIAAGRRVSGRTGGAAAGGVRADHDRLSAIRRWANENGMQVSARGRIPKSVQTAYHTARSAEPA